MRTKEDKRENGTRERFNKVDSGEGSTGHGVWIRVSFWQVLLTTQLKTIGLFLGFFTFP